jgi:hypothetical protein
VLKHRVSLLVQHVELLLVLLQLFLLLKDLGARVLATKLTNIRWLTHMLKSLVEISTLGTSLAFCHNLRILQLLVDLFQSLSALEATRLSKLLDIAGERLSKHLGVKSWEFLEDGLEHKLLGQGEGLDLSQSNIVELRSLGAQHVVVSDVTVVNAARSNETAFISHVFRYLQIFVFVLLVTVGGSQVTIVGNSPFTFQNEVDLGDVSFFHQNVPVFLCVFELTGHKSKCNFVNKVRIEFFAHLEEGLEGGLVNDVLEQELAHDVLLNLERNRIEILFLFEKNCSSVIVPEVAEVGFDAVAEVGVDVFGAANRLIFYLFNQDKPLLQNVFIVTEVAGFH